LRTLSQLVIEEINNLATRLQWVSHDSAKFDDGPMQQTKIDPLWDEGISSHLLGEFDRNQAPLSIHDLQSFANEHAVRIGDILETLYLMAIYGEWKHTNADGVEKELDVVALDELYAKGRLSPEDLVDFEGLWSPVE
jgi:hypothetical protein